MEPTGALTIIPQDNGQSILSAQDAEHTFTVPGIILEDQYRLHDDQYLLVTSDDCPYEECLHLLLIDFPNATFEQIDIGQVNTPGIYKDANLVDDRTLAFSFMGDNRFSATVATAPRRSLSTLGIGSAISYASPWTKKRLFVTQQK